MRLRPHSIAAHLASEFAVGRLTRDPAQSLAAERLDRLSAGLEARPLPRPFWRRGAHAALRGIYLWGSVGRGKTYLMDLFYASLNFPEKEREHFYRFMQGVHAELRAAAHRTDPLEHVAAALAARSRVLCLDELLVDDIADAMILGGLLGALIRRGVTLVATSNRPPRDLYKDGLQRQRFLPAIRLLEEHLDTVELNGGTDYRLRHLQGARIYVDSADPHGDAALRAVFRACVPGEASGPLTLSVGGRPIAAIDSGGGVAWFEFSALCRAARAADDYLELAQRCHTLIVSGVPIFDSNDDDAARRFIMLVDTLYDRGTALVVSAAAEPPQLYQGERLRFDFERTASRLLEMRSTHYLERRRTD
jgi:cell division protein ZapE